MQQCLHAAMLQQVSRCRPSTTWICAPTWICITYCMVYQTRQPSLQARHHILLLASFVSLVLVCVEPVMPSVAFNGSPSIAALPRLHTWLQNEAMYDMSEREQMWCTGGGVCTGVASHGQAGADRGSARPPAGSCHASHAGTLALPPLHHLVHSSSS